MRPLPLALVLGGARSSRPGFASFPEALDILTVVPPRSVVVGADGPISGVRANLLAAAFQAGEIALRTVKPGVRNWEVTEAVKALVKEYEASGVKGVEGTLSHQFLQNNLEAKKGLVAFPTASQRGDSDNTYNLEEGEVYGLNILVTDGERSVRPALPLSLRRSTPARPPRGRPSSERSRA